MNEEPIWIRDLLTRLWYSCAEPGYVSTRQELLREWVLREASLHHDGIQKLRDACSEHLQDDDIGLVINAVSCLFVVGDKSNMEQLEHLGSHPDEDVRKAVRTSIFEIRSRTRKGT